MDGLLGMKIKHHLFYRGGRVEEEEKNGDNNELLICFGGSSQVWPQTHSCHIYFLYNKVFCPFQQLPLPSLVPWYGFSSWQGTLQGPWTSPHTLIFGTKGLPGHWNRCLVSLSLGTLSLMKKTKNWVGGHTCVLAAGLGSSVRDLGGTAVSVWTNVPIPDIFRVLIASL